MDFFFSTENRPDILSNEGSNIDLESSSFFSNDIISYHSNLNLCNSNLSLPTPNTNILTDNVPLYVEQPIQQQQQQSQQQLLNNIDYNQIQQQIQNQLFQYNQQLQQQQHLPNVNSSTNNTQQWQQLFSSDYSSSPESSNQQSPTNELPQSPTYNYNTSTNLMVPSMNENYIVVPPPHMTVQFNSPEDQNMLETSPETFVVQIPSPSTSSTSSSDEKLVKPKKIKKRKLFDPSEFRGADLSDVLLEISSEEFKEYKKNFFSGSKISKSDQNLINAQYRKIKNRESAQRSREKKTKHTEEVEDELDKVRAELEDAKQENKRLKTENESLRKQNEAYSSSMVSNFPTSNQYQSFSNVFNSVLSPIGSSSSSIVNTKKVLCIFIFAIALCFYMAATPNFNNQYGYHQSSSVTTLGGQHSVNNGQFGRVQQFGGAGSNNLQFGRSPLGTDEQLRTASYNFDSLNNHHLDNDLLPQSQDKQQQQPQQLNNDPQQLLNRQHIKPWSATDNVKATFAFNPNSGLKVYKSLPKSIRDRIANRHPASILSMDKQVYDKLTDDLDENLHVDNDNIIFSNHAESGIPLLDDGDDSTNNIKTSKSTTTTTTTTTTTSVPCARVNNSTMELTVQNNFQIIDNLNNPGSSNSTRLPASTYNFKFLIDGNSFLGSNEVAKALAESHNQHLEFISILVQINKNPPL